MGGVCVCVCVCVFVCVYVCVLNRIRRKNKCKMGGRKRKRERERCRDSCTSDALETPWLHTFSCFFSKCSSCLQNPGLGLTCAQPRWHHVRNKITQGANTYEAFFQAVSCCHSHPDTRSIVSLTQERAAFSARKHSFKESEVADIRYTSEIVDERDIPAILHGIDIEVSGGVQATLKLGIQNNGKMLHTRKDAQ